MQCADCGGGIVEEIDVDDGIKEGEICDGRGELDLPS
jgi:hypothetical protein